jgi:hypothetical protein
MTQRIFPIQVDHRVVKPHPTSIPWAIADLAYSVYSAESGRSQSLEDLARRGGFGAGEMDMFLPDWRERCSAIDEATRPLVEALRAIQYKAGSHTVIPHPAYRLVADDPGFAGIWEVARAALAAHEERTPPQPQADAPKPLALEVDVARKALLAAAQRLADMGLDCMCDSNLRDWADQLPKP